MHLVRIHPADLARPLRDLGGSRTPAPTPPALAVRCQLVRSCATVPWLLIRRTRRVVRVDHPVPPHPGDPRHLCPAAGTCAPFARPRAPPAPPRAAPRAGLVLVSADMPPPRVPQSHPRVHHRVANPHVAHSGRIGRSPTHPLQRTVRPLTGATFCCGPLPHPPRPSPAVDPDVAEHSFSPATSTLIVSPSTTSITWASVILRRSAWVDSRCRRCSVGDGCGDGASIALGSPTIAVDRLMYVALAVTVTAPRRRAIAGVSAPAPDQPDQHAHRSHDHPTAALTCSPFVVRAGLFDASTLIVEFQVRTPTGNIIRASIR